MRQFWEALHWLLKCAVAGLVGGGTAVSVMMSATTFLPGPQRVDWTKDWVQLIPLFLVMALVTGGAYWLKGPQPDKAGQP